MATTTSTVPTAVDAANELPPGGEGSLLTYTVTLSIGLPFAVAGVATFFYLRWRRRHRQAGNSTSRAEETLQLQPHTPSRQRPVAPPPTASSSSRRTGPETPTPGATEEEPASQPLPPPTPSRSLTKKMPARSFSRLREPTTPSRSANSLQTRPLAKAVKQSTSQSSLTTNSSEGIGRAY